MENKLPKRKKLRLKNYDYSTPGAYFITFCTHNRNCTLSHPVGAIHESPEKNTPIPVGAIHESPGKTHESPDLQLTEMGKIIDGVINNIPQRLKTTIDRYVIMPNHVHLIVVITDDAELRAIRESPLRGRSLVSKTIGYIKMNASKEIHIRCGDMKIWQRGYHDHIIRNQNDYERIAEYIYENPKKWLHDCFFQKTP